MSRTPDYPRVLLVNGQAIGQKSGVGTTLASLFWGWPQKRIAQIVPQGACPDTSICGNTWMLAPPGELHGSLTRKLYNLAGYQLSPELLSWIRDFKPDLIYSYLELPLITNLVNKLAHHVSCPIIPHLMDEWHNIPSRGKLSDYWWFVRRWIDFSRLLKQAPFGLTISDAMAEEYQQRFRKPFFTFMNGADPELYLPLQHMNPPDAPLRLVYAGSGPGLGRWPIIMNLARTVQQLNQNGYRIEFTAFAHMNALDEVPAPGNGFLLRDFSNETELATLLSGSDVAVLAEGFDPKFIRYTRLSFSSKIPAYLMAGCCILAIGPVENNSIRYIKTNGLGVISDGNCTNLTSLIIELYNVRHEELKKYHSNNRQFALESHNRSSQHERFVAVLAEARERRSAGAR